MQAGKLRNRIIIARKIKTQNTFGEDVVELRSIGDYWASVTALQGRELESAQQTWADARYKLTMRCQPTIDIRNEDVITYGGTSLDILDVADVDGRQERIRIYAKAFVA